MFTKVEVLSRESDGVILAVTAKTGVKKQSQSAAFRAGTVKFRFDTRTIQYPDTDPIPMPDGLDLKAGDKVTFHLFSEDGKPLHNKARVATLAVRKEPKEGPDFLVAQGATRAPRVAPEGTKRRYKAFAFRAYFRHDGVKTNKTLPDWLVTAIRRNEAAWNDLAVAIAAIRKSRFGMPADQYIDKLTEFKENTIVPALKAFNDSLGRHSAKEKISLPKYLHRRWLSVKDEQNPNAKPVATNEHLDLELFMRFAYGLKKRAEEGQRVPEWDGKPLAQVTEDWIKGFKVDWTQFNEFRNKDFKSLVNEIAEKHLLTSQEKALLLRKIETILKSQKTKKMGPDKGWPREKFLPFDADLRKADWTIIHNPNTPGISVADLYNPERSGTSRDGKKVPLHLSFGAPASPDKSGHPNIRPNAKGEPSRQMRKSLVPVTVSLPRYEDDGNDGLLTIAVLQHVPFPKDAIFKQWTLSNRDGQLWLSVAVEMLAELHAPSEHKVMAGLDIGWRKVGDDLRIATIHDPSNNTHFFATVALNERRGFQPEFEPSKRRKLHYPIGMSSHWTRQTARERDRKLAAEGLTVEGELASLPHAHEVLSKSVKPSAFQDETGAEIFKSWVEFAQRPLDRNEPSLAIAGKPYDAAVRASLDAFNYLMRTGQTVDAYLDVYSSLLRASKMFTFEDGLDSQEDVRRHRDLLKDGAKEAARRLMGEECPAWWPNIGARGLKERAASDDTKPEVRALLNAWADVDSLFASMLTVVAGRTARRIEEAHHILAHDICKQLVGKVAGIVVEKDFLAKLSQQKSNYDSPSLKNSAKIRHRLGLSKFVNVLKHTAEKYNLLFEEANPAFSTRIHFACGTDNGPHDELTYVCTGCGETVDQDVNAAMNLSKSEVLA